MLRHWREIEPFGKCVLVVVALTVAATVACIVWGAVLILPQLALAP